MKLANRPAVKPTGPLATTGSYGDVRTHEGAPAYAKDAKTELFQLAVVNMVSEDTFYESAAARDSRFERLVRQVVAEDPAWLARFVPFLREQMLMRSASVVLAAEYVAAGGPNGRSVVAAALQRADEPAEFLGYWFSKYGRKLPAAAKRGVADAAVRLYNEYTAPKYDREPWRIGDVLQVVHPKPTAQWQSDLFKYMLDKRYGADTEIPDTLPKLQARAVMLDRLNGSERDAVLRDPDVQQALRSAGLTWENVAGTGAMNAAAWEAVLPSMGYMAVLRNLRNFEQAGIGQDAVRYVNELLADPERVRASKQLPFRFWSAYKATLSNKFRGAIEAALDVSVENIPTLDGDTLVLVDTSGSMDATLSAHSTVARWEVGALFGVAFALRNSGKLVEFATGSRTVPVRTGQSVLTAMQAVKPGSVGHGTELHKALRASYDGQRRVVVFSDMQTMDSNGQFNVYSYGWDWSSQTKDPVANAEFVYAFDLAGYATTPIATAPGRYQLGGFSDKLFTLMQLLERNGTDWPF